MPYETPAEPSWRVCVCVYVRLSRKLHMLAQGKESGEKKADLYNKHGGETRYWAGKTIGLLCKVSVCGMTFLSGFDFIVIIFYPTNSYCKRSFLENSFFSLFVIIFVYDGIFLNWCLFYLIYFNPNELPL